MKRSTVKFCPRDFDAWKTFPGYFQPEKVWPQKRPDRDPRDRENWSQQTQKKEESRVAIGPADNNLECLEPRRQVSRPLSLFVRQHAARSAMPRVTGVFGDRGTRKWLRLRLQRPVDKAQLLVTTTANAAVGSQSNATMAENFVSSLLVNPVLMF